MGAALLEDLLAVVVDVLLVGHDEVVRVGAQLAQGVDAHFELGAAAFLTKPVDRGELAQALRAVLDFEDEACRARALAALAPQLEGTARQEALAQGLSASGPSITRITSAKVMSSGLRPRA